MDENKPVRLCGVKDCIFAYIIFLITAVLIDRSYVLSQGTTAFIVTCALGLAVTVYMIVKSQTKHYGGIVFIALSFVFTLPLLLSLNGVIITLSQLFAYVLFSYGIYVFGGRSDGTLLNDDTFLYLIRCLFVVPFVHFASIFKAMFGVIKSKGKHTFLYILAGVAIAIIPTAIVILLLFNGDMAFSMLISKIEIKEDIFEHILKFIVWTVPAACYIFGMAFGSTYGVADKVKRRNTAVVNQILMYSFALPPLAVYAVYFFAQFAYFTSAFANVLPQGLSYADYARMGFIELWFVALINLLIVDFLHYLTKRTDDGKIRIGQKITVILYCVSTLILISTAVARMALYISMYGYTHKRIYTSLFMIFLAIVFIGIILRYFWHKVNLASIIAVSLIVIFGVMTFVDIDAFCAKQNVERYLSGKTETIDIGYFYELSPTAAEYAIPLLDCDDSEVVEYAKLYLNYQKTDLQIQIESGNGNVASHRVYDSIKDLDLETKHK